MNQDEAEKLLGRLGCNRIKTRGNGWVESSCPFASSKHGKGRDEHPSFGISVVPGGTSRYRCFGCGSSGDMTQFIWNLERASRRKYAELASFVSMTNAPSLSDISRRLAYAEAPDKAVKVAGIIPSSSIRRDPVELKELPDFTLDAFTFDFPSACWEWLTVDRGVDEDTLKRWEVAWDPNKGRVQIPIRDCEKKLVGISGRSWPRDRVPKYLHTTGFHRDYYLFGEVHHVAGVPAILVEGQFDVIKLAMMGYRNVFGIFGSYVSDMQVEKLAQWCPSVRVVPDGDQAGRTGAESSAKRIGKKLPVTVVEVPDGPDPGDYDVSLAGRLLGEPA